jgi:hypothetical protein
VLVTNIDIVFSDELVSYLAEGQLQKNRMYRIDRLDVLSDVPIDGTVDEQLRYCRSHLIRCNTRNGTFSLTSDGQRTLERVDIAAPGCEVSFGEGWFPPESDGLGSTYRWMENDAEVTVRRPPGLLEPLTFELEPGPSAGDRPLTLQAVDDAGRILTESAITGRSQISLSLLPRRETVVSFRFCLTGGGLPVPHDPRNLNLRAMRCCWESSARCVPPAAVAQTTGLWMRMMRVLDSLAKDGCVNIALPQHSKLRGIIQTYVRAGGITGAVRRRNHRQPAPAPAATADLRVSSTANKDVARPALLHTNACGDFTLMAREHWFDLRGYPEFALFSMNLDSVLCHSAHHAGFREEILRDPLRIYHIEHDTGWTPEGQVPLFDRLRSRGIPWLEYQEFIVLAQQMQRLDSPMIFNRLNWGLADLEFEETVLGARCSVAAPHSERSNRRREART